jgi:hypothetical protein
MFCGRTFEARAAITHLRRRPTSTPPPAANITALREVSTIVVLVLFVGYRSFVLVLVLIRTNQDERTMLELIFEPGSVSLCANGRY